MISFSLEDSGMEEARERVAGIKERLEDLRPAFQAIHHLFLIRRHLDFRTQGGTTKHGAWQALSPATVRRKGHGRILWRSQRLQRSLARHGHPDHVFRADRKTIHAMGTRVPYARFHQEGRGVSVRRPVDPKDEEIQRYGQILLQYVTTGETPFGYLAGEGM